MTYFYNLLWGLQHLLVQKLLKNEWEVSMRGSFYSIKFLIKVKFFKKLKTRSMIQFVKTHIKMTYQSQY